MYKGFIVRKNKKLIITNYVQERPRANGENRARLAKKVYA
jgi:hypothetical protein